MKILFIEEECPLVKKLMCRLQTSSQMCADIEMILKRHQINYGKLMTTGSSMQLIADGDAELLLSVFQENGIELLDIPRHDLHL